MSRGGAVLRIRTSIPDACVCTAWGEQQSSPVQVLSNGLSPERHSFVRLALAILVLQVLVSSRRFRVSSQIQSPLLVQVASEGARPQSPTHTHRDTGIPCADVGVLSPPLLPEGCVCVCRVVSLNKEVGTLNLDDFILDSLLLCLAILFKKKKNESFGKPASRGFPPVATQVGT